MSAAIKTFHKAWQSKAGLRILAKGAMRILAKGAKGARLDFQAILGSTLIDHLVRRSMAFSQEVHDGLNLRNLTFD